MLSAEEYKKILFYTNEDQRGSKDILNEKRHLEHWHHGKKDQGVALIASGFGLGDNAGVDAVFLFDVNDVNDQLQKGGRTARNGDEGRVFKFYLKKDIQLEEERLTQALHYQGIDLKPLYSDHQNHVASSDSERFRNVMQMRAALFEMSMDAQTYYHELIAQFSSAAMKKLSNPDLADRVGLESKIRQAQKDFSKKWKELQGNSTLNTHRRAKQIRALIIKQAHILGLMEMHHVGHRSVYKLVSYPIYKGYKHKLGFTQKPELSLGDRNMNQIISVFLQMKDFDANATQFAEIKELLLKMQHNHKQLEVFVGLAQRCKTVNDFYDRLNRVLSQNQTESLDDEDLISESKKFEPLLNHLIGSLEEKARLAIRKALNHLGDKSECATKVHDC